MPITPEPQNLSSACDFFRRPKVLAGTEVAAYPGFICSHQTVTKSFALMFNYGIYCYPLHLLMEECDMQFIQYGVVILGLGVVAAVLFAFERQISGKHRRRLRNISREKSQR
ncbi:MULTISPECIES: hypothetical protein [Klebsiella]|uniref:hypothetical protein n=1 Tax=Klebsiella TaxID=570 RepID=UPI002AB9E30F|nr:hypothetical protein [Klebsiella pneumoniae]MDZ0162933.1 hypothetical protein [Klebsiella pneumoniae]